MADFVDRRELGEPLAGLVDQADVLEGDAQACCQGGQQFDVGVGERVLAVDVLERDDAARLVADEERDPERRTTAARRTGPGLTELDHAGRDPG